MMRKLIYRCDDAAGFELHILQQDDGDLWLSIKPNLADMEREHIDHNRYNAIYGATVRVRTPMMGGGSHENLWHALANLFKKDKRQVMDVHARI